MNPILESDLQQTRRHFLGRAATGIGTAAFASLLGRENAVAGGMSGLPHFPAKVKRVIYLHMVGGPAQMDLFDYKPAMQDWFDKDLPESVRNGQRLTTMTSGQSRFPIAPSKFKFSAAGDCGLMMNTELLPARA